MSAVENVADVLDAAADLLEKPGAWTQGTYFRNTDGCYVDVDHAECFCALGAIRKVGGYDQDGRRDWNPAAQFLVQIVGGEDGVHGWNDAPGRTQAEVVAKLREAAALARQEQAA